MKDVKTMTTRELIDEYNTLTGKSTQRFSTRKAAERQVENARLQPKAKTGKVTEIPVHVPPSKIPAAAVTAKPKRVRKVKEVVTLNRNESIRESWNDKATAASRSKKDRVSVDNEEYRSVGEAFRQLHLPIGQAIRFRLTLKSEGRKPFEFNGKTYNFAIVEKTA